MLNFNFVSIHSVLSFIANIIMLIAGIGGLLRFEKIWQKLVSVVILTVCVADIALTLYLAPSPSQIEADLNLSICQPLVVTKNSTYVNDLAPNSEYTVLCGKYLPINTKVSVELIHRKTLVSNKYNIFNTQQNQHIQGVDSGEYILRIYIEDILVQTDYITLSSSNLDDNGQWTYCAYIMNDFFDNAIQQSIYIPQEEYHKVMVPVYTIHTDDANVFDIFEESYDTESGELHNEYYFVSGKTYYLNNAVVPTEMCPIEILVP